ncbi:MAG: holin [Caldilineaceae bacterium]
MTAEQQASEALIATNASHVTQIGAWGSVFAWLASAEAAVIFGILLGAAGLAVNVFFSWRRDRRETREHETRMRDSQQER